jgi:hypothetical protein
MPDLPTDPRHRSFGPLPQHTNACIADAARWGFCDHTRLVTAPQLVARKARYLANRRRQRLVRATLSYLGLTLVVLTTIYLAQHLPFPAILWVIPAFSLGWLLVFTCGLPRFLTDGPDDIVPPDRARALRNEIT